MSITDYALIIVVSGALFAAGAVVQSRDVQRMNTIDYVMMIVVSGAIFAAGAVMQARDVQRTCDDKSVVTLQGIEYTCYRK